MQVDPQLGLCHGRIRLTAGPGSRQHQAHGSTRRRNPSAWRTPAGLAASTGTLAYHLFEPLTALPHLAEVAGHSSGLPRQRADHRPELAEIAILRYFAGLSADETAAVLGISASTLRSGAFARAWLVRRLGQGEVSGGAGPADA